MHLVLSPKGKQTHAFCQIDLGAETNIIPNSLYNQLKPTMKLTAYGGNEIPNLGSCQVYVKGPDNPYPKSVQAEIVDVDDPAVNRQYVSTKFESSKAKLDSCCWEQQQTCPSGLETVPLTKEYLSIEDVFTGDVCFPGSPIPHRNQPEQLPSTIPSEASPSPIII